MSLEYEGVFFIDWVINMLILQYISANKLNKWLIVAIPTLCTALYVINYDIVFFGEIFFLPMFLLYFKKKYNWTWQQYIFYSMFPFVVSDLFARITDLYIRYTLHLTQVEWWHFYWSDWITTLMSIPMYLGLFKLFRLNFNEINEGFQNKQILSALRKFNLSLLFYGFAVFILSDLQTMQEQNVIIGNIDYVYYRRHVILIYLVIFVGMMFYINYIIKENKSQEIQERKNEQLVAMSAYSRHVESLYEEIRSFRHDYTNIIVSLDQAIKEKNIESVEKIYNGVIAQTGKQFSNSKYDIANLSNLKNEAVKSVVAAKLMEAQSLNIEVSVEIEKAIEVINIEMIDFITLLSIFLDNAIEGAKEAEHPKIELAYLEDEGHQVLLVQNTMKESKINTKKIYDRGVSSKGNNRGIGLSNVKKILEKYPSHSLQTDSSNFIFTQKLFF